MSPTDEDYCFFETVQGRAVCAECGDPCKEVGSMRMCFHCDGWEDPDEFGSITKVLKLLPATHTLLKQFGAEGLAGLDVEELAIAIWETPEVKCA